MPGAHTFFARSRARRIAAVNQAEGTATGTFELIAVNRADPSDPRYLTMRGGLFNADM